MRVLITGAGGFIGKNLLQHLAERKDVDVVCFTRANSLEELPALLKGVNFVFHLAGINRPKDPQEFFAGNSGLTAALIGAMEGEIASRGKPINIVYSSSVQALRDNPYGASKRAAEESLNSYAARTGAAAYVFRLPNVFGKWCRPNYNSAVATFCHNTARGIPIQINDPAAALDLVYVDDVLEEFIRLMDGGEVNISSDGFATVRLQYSTSVGAMADLIASFRHSRDTMMTDRVGDGFVRALYSTYVSYLPPEMFAYSLPMHGDARGTFVEMLKTPDCGQFSFFTAHPGVTRGGHYHHTKTEKFLVIKGLARFRFRQLQTGISHELVTSGAKAEVVETVPGWTHDITNIGDEELLVMLWANEVFDKSRPDTYSCPL